MRAVAPRVGCEEVTLAAEQEDYHEITAAVVRYEDGSVGMLTRWRLTELEKYAVFRGDDLYLTVLTNGRPVQPVMLEVGPPAWASTRLPPDSENQQ